MVYRILASLLATACLASYANAQIHPSLTEAAERLDSVDAPDAWVCRSNESPDTYAMTMDFDNYTWADAKVEARKVIGSTSYRSTYEITGPVTPWPGGKAVIELKYTSDRSGQRLPHSADHLPNGAQWDDPARNVFYLEVVSPTGGNEADALFLEGRLTSDSGVHTLTCAVN